LDRFLGLNVVHVAKFYPPEWGGMESVTRDLAVGAAQAGFDTSVVAFTKTGPARSEQIENVSIERATATSIASQPLSARWLKHAIIKARRTDIVHIHLPNMLAAGIFPFIPSRTKIVLHWHSDVVGKALLSRLTRPLELMMARRADAIIATSQPYADASEILKKFSNKVHVIPLGIHDPAAGPIAALPDDLQSFIAGRRQLLSVGRMVPYKGFTYLLDAMQNTSPDCCLIIVGGGELFSELQKQIDDKGLQTRVKLAGKLPLDHLNALFANASIYVMPSILRSEAFGVVLLEAMAHNLPIIATKIEGSGVPWVNQDSETGINVEPGNAAELATTIDQLLADPGTLLQYAKAARKRYLQHFTAQKMTDSTLALYQRINTL
jgi:glycosyltransferase involved in cell wall biosynthesis